jgi:addiction module HigA family antidote
MEKLPNIHPGEILKEEFLKPFNLTAYRLSKETKMPATRIAEIIKGKRRITADTALRLSKFFAFHQISKATLQIHFHYNLLI